MVARKVKKPKRKVTRSAKEERCVLAVKKTKMAKRGKVNPYAVCKAIGKKKKVKRKTIKKK